MTDTLLDVIMENEKLIYSIINKYTNYYDKEDLYQVGVIGMINAYNNYNRSYDTKFTSYAYMYILGSVLKYVNNNRDFKIRKENLILYKRIMEATSLLTQKLMKEPTIKDLALFLEIDENTLNDVINNFNKMDSLDREIKEDSKNLLLRDIIPNNNDYNNIDYILINDEVDKLDKNDKILVKARYYEDKSQQEIANILGINQVQVSRNEQKILKKLKKKIENGNVW